MLVAPVVEPGAVSRAVYLPAGPEFWIDYHTGAPHPAGSTVRIDAPLGRPPVFVRAGAALVLARGAIPQTRPHDAPPRTLYLAPGFKNGRGTSPHFEDDGESWSSRSGDFLACDVELAWTRDGVELSLRRTGGARRPPELSEFEIVCPTEGGRRVNR